MKDLAITGLGVVSAQGVGRAAFFDAMGDPASAISAGVRQGSETLDNDRLGPTRTAEVWDWDPQQWLGKKGHRSFDRLTKFMIAAGKLALADAGIQKDGEFLAHSATRVGIASATAYGSLDAITELKNVSELEDPRYLNPTRFPNTVINAAAGYVSIWNDLRAPNTTVVDGNCGSLDAVLNCETHLRNDRGDAFLVGGGEIVSEPLYLAMRKLRLLDTDEIEGITMGEGACYLVVERKDEALARRANVMAEIVGYGTAFEPPTRAALIVGASDQAIARSIDMALDCAGLGEDDIDLVCASRCGLEETDLPEEEAIRCTLGRQIAVVAPKVYTGETFGAAGAFAMATALAWFDGKPLPPLVYGNSPKALQHILINAVGYYGNVSSVILRSATE